MPTRRKRASTQEQATQPEATPETSLLCQIRNMEEFAALGQFLFMFGSQALKLPDFSLEDLEAGFMDGQSELTTQVLKALLKMVTSDSKLAPEQFDECARKQYRRWKPTENPFGEREVAKPFAEMDLPTKICVLHQLSIWTFARPQLIRDRMGDVDAAEELTWRMDPCGYDSKGNTYFILDDNRLYRRSPPKEPEAPARKPKSRSKRRAPKRRRVSTATTADQEEEEKEHVTGAQLPAWECVCASLQDWENFVAGLVVLKDDDEKALHKYLEDDVLPEIRKVEKNRMKVIIDKEKARIKQEAVANRKRSSRIDSRMARKREEEEKAAEKHKLALLLKKTNLEEQKKYREREARMAERERRKARDERFREHEPQSRAMSGNDNGVNGRRSSARVRSKQSSEDTGWVFDCECGVHGIQYEDGSSILSCDKCDVWQHLACQDLPPGFTEGDFTCKRCRRIEESSAGSSHIPVRSQDGPPGAGDPPPDSMSSEKNGVELNSQPAANEQPLNGLKSTSGSTLGTHLKGDGEHSPGTQDVATSETSLVPPLAVQAASASGRTQDAKVTSATRDDAYDDGVAARKAALASAEHLLSAADPTCLQKPGPWVTTPQTPTANGIQKSSSNLERVEDTGSCYPPSISWPTNGLPGTATTGSSPLNDSSTFGFLGTNNGTTHGLYRSPNIVAGPTPPAHS